MAYTLLGAPKPQWFDDDGKPVANGFLGIFVAGTDTPAPTYSDPNGGAGNLNAQPCPLNAAGRPESGAIYCPAGSYKFILEDSGHVEIWTQDAVTFSDPA